MKEKKPRKLVTRGGLNARIICTDKKNTNFPIVALVDLEGKEVTLHYTKDGYFYNDGGIDANDLFFAPEKHEGWITLCRDRNMNLYTSNPFKSEETAINFGRMQDGTYIKTIKIEWEE